MYTQIATSSEIVKNLQRGTVETVDFALTGAQWAWCQITMAGRAGYVRCDELERERLLQWRESAAPSALRADRRSAMQARLKLRQFFHKDKRRKPPLMFAVENGNTEAVKALLAQTADVNAKTRKHGNTALMYAAAYGGIAAVQELIAAGAKVNAAAEGEIAGDPWGYHHTALMFAASVAHTDVGRLLLAARADVHARDVFGNTVLVHASGGGISPNIQALLAAAPDVHPKTAMSHTALMYAKSRGHTAIV